MNTILDVIRDTFQEDLTPDLIATIADSNLVPYTKLRELSRHLASFSGTARAPEIPSDHLRPYIPVNHMRQHGGAAPTGIPLRFYGYDLDNRTSAEAAVNSILHHLLYCHSVAIDDTLGFTLDFFSDWAWLEERRPQLITYLEFIHMIKPLIESGVVVLIERPVESGWNISLTPTLSGAEEEALARRPDYISLLQEGESSPVDEAFCQAHVHVASGVIGHELVASHHHGGNLDLYLPFKHYVPVLNTFAERANRELRRGSRTQELRLLGDLLSLDLPRVGTLSADDVVRIRSDDTFESFRRTLRQALERLRDIPHDFDHQAEKRRRLSDEMTHAQKQLEAEFKKSSFLSTVQSGVVKLGIGALAATAFKASAVSLETGATSAILTILYDLWKNRVPPAKRTLMNHFMVMTP
jgi:hypothetical protein